MSNWQEYDLENKIRQILSSIPESVDDHHLGRSYLTAYQIAIEFENRYPNDFSALNLPLGGVGTGQHSSLAQYIARQLSGRIKSGEINYIEGGFLSNLHLNDISFTRTGEPPIRSSLTNSSSPLSMYRYTGT